MSVVRINALDVPPEMAGTLEERFAKRAGEVEAMDGFEGFELLRPTDGSNRYFVYTRWRDAAAFQAWVDSREFQHGHAQSSGDAPSDAGSSPPSAPSDAGSSPPSAPSDAGSGEGSDRPSRGPAATGSELLSFEVVLAAGPATATPAVGVDEEE